MQQSVLAVANMQIYSCILTNSCGICFLGIGAVPRDVKPKTNFPNNLIQEETDE